MGMQLPERVFYTVEEIARHWQVSLTAVWQWLMDGELRIHVWVPLIGVFKRDTGGELHLSHWEGYVPLSRHQCRRLFRRERIHLREFVSGSEGERYLIPDTAEDITVEIAATVILQEERLRFERMHGLAFNGSRSSAIKQEATENRFKSVHFEGKDYLFGEMQSAVLRYLYEAYLDGNPWQNGKRLLGKIGSQSFSLGNLFKRQPIWRKLVRSDRRGFYRMSEEFLATLN